MDKIDFDLNWQICENKFELALSKTNESLFSIGNGYIGWRGNFEEGLPESHKQYTVEGTYINGFYESHEIKYPEDAYGWAKTGQAMLNVTKAKGILLYIEGEQFDLLSGKVLNYQRVLDMKSGVLTRKVHWQSSKGHEVVIDIRRLVSLSNKHLAMIEYQVTPLNFEGELQLISTLNAYVMNQQTEDDPRSGSALVGQVLELKGFSFEKAGAWVKQTAKQTQHSLVCGMMHQVETNNVYTSNQQQNDQCFEQSYIIQATKNNPVKLTKWVAYTTTQDVMDAELVEVTMKALNVAKAQGSEALFNAQGAYMAKFWRLQDIKITGQPELQQGVRFSLFQLLQSVGQDGKTSIAAKGLTGEGYGGHYFWDAEAYVAPCFVFTNPEITKSMLLYRYHTLDAARARANEMGHPGALFAWRTIAGSECSSYFPAGTAQYHINADIIYALKTYIEATNDQSFLQAYGVEMAVETARLFMDLGDYCERRNSQFCIFGVTGPDEYTAMVNNNYYTNIMAKMNLQFAYDALQKLKADEPKAYEVLVEKLSLQHNEAQAWQAAAEAMYLPFDRELNILKQDDDFLEKPIMDLSKISTDKKPIFLHQHYLNIYRHQVCKQADALLAVWLFGDQYSNEVKKASFDYYEKITTHDSSLSMCTFSILASELGYHKKAYDYFMQSARLDLDNLHHNTHDGVHIANMGGNWLCVVQGFAGMRFQNGHLSFNPYLPEGWEGYCFNIRHQDALLEVQVDGDGAHYALIEGEKVQFMHQGVLQSLVCGVF